MPEDIIGGGLFLFCCFYKVVISGTMLRKNNGKAKPAFGLPTKLQDSLIPKQETLISKQAANAIITISTDCFWLVLQLFNDSWLFPFLYK